MTEIRLVFLSPERGEPSPFLIVRDTGGIVARGTLAPGATPLPVRTVLVVPGTDVLIRWIELPACTPAQASAAAILMLKNEIAVPRESVHLALGAPDKDGWRPMGIVDRSVMQRFIDRAGDIGIAPDAIVPDAMMLTYPGDDTVLAAICDGRIIARGKRLAFSTEPELAGLLIGKHPMRVIERAEEIEILFAAAARHPAIDLLQRDFARGRPGSFKARDFRRAALLAAALLLSPFALWTAQAVSSHALARSLEARAEASARAIPGAQGAADPISYVRGRLAELEANDRFLLATVTLFDAVARMKGAELENFSYLREGAIRATLLHADAAEMEGLSRTLEQSRIGFGQEPATGRRGEPGATIMLRPRP